MDAQMIRKLRNELSDQIDGGEECRAHDSRVSRWIAMCDIALGDEGDYVDPWMRRMLTEEAKAEARS